MWPKGKGRSEETKEKQRRKMKLFRHSPEQLIKMSDAASRQWADQGFRNSFALARIGEANPFFGRTHSEEIKLLWSSQRIGELNSNWQGGISYQQYPIEFNNELKERIRSRDCYRCQLCGISQLECLHALNVHHIDYDKLNNTDDNLISLCDDCHGDTNYNRAYWLKLFLLWKQIRGCLCIKKIG
jgi:hypothetical protein